MRLIGLTGGIATGKTRVAGMLAALGATVIDADSLAREVVEPGRPALAEIGERFGAVVIAADGSLDRVRLGGIVFADPRARHDLERITHPRINELMQERVAEAATRGDRVVVLDIPLLLESGRGDQFEGVLLVYATEATQVRRLMQRDGIDEPAARQRLNAQLPIEEKRRRATWIIDNDDGIEATRAQVERWWATTILR